MSAFRRQWERVTVSSAWVFKTFEDLSGQKKISFSNIIYFILYKSFVIFIWMFFHLRGRKETQKSLWWVWVRCSSHVPSQPLTLTHFTGLWGWRCLEETLDAAQELLSHSKNIGVLSTLLYPQKQSTEPCKLLWRKLTPSQPDSVQYGNC